ncbi:MAG: pyrimidine 5'-nucleotidase [Anaerolineaceae bacterium]|nr:pyrimidine 5'-nucleotidase [Anaerolineaceae bacterium]
MAYSTIIFDLDDTIYPPSCHVWDMISDRIHTYMIDKIGIPHEQVSGIRSQYYQTYGTTLRGLVMHHHIDPHEYLNFVHDIPVLDQLIPDPKVKEMLQSLPHQKYIFTNSDKNHANRILNHLDIQDQFADIVGIMDIFPSCKPMKEAFDIALKKIGQLPEECIFIDDSIKNLNQAKQLGIYTILPNANTIKIDSPHATIINLTDIPQVIPG